MRKFTEEQMARVRAGLPAFPPVGSANPAAKLTEEKVRAIREAYGPVRGNMWSRHPPRGRTITSLAAEYGVSKDVVHRIVHRKSWRHV